MRKEVIEVLDPGPNGVYVDATVGPGGHSEEILKHIGSGGVLIAIDRDDEALKMAEERLSDRRVVLKRGSFADMESMVYAEGISSVDGVLFDLGMSMLQLKSPDKGFSFTSDARLDMRTLRFLEEDVKWTGKKEKGFPASPKASKNEKSEVERRYT